MSIMTSLIDFLLLTVKLVFGKPANYANLLPNGTATQRQHQDCRLSIVIYIRRTDVFKKSLVDCSRIAEKSWK